jgi:hypothetical protein
MKNGFLEFRAKYVSSDLDNSSGLLNSASLSKEDLILVKSSQEIYGRNNLLKKDKKHLTHRKINGNEKKKTIESPPLVSLGGGLVSLQTLNRSKSSQSHAMDETQEIEKLFQKKLDEIIKLKQSLQQSHNKKGDSNYLVMILQMPNVHRTLFFVSKILHRLRKEKGFRCWKLIISQMKYFEFQQIRKQKQIFLQTQRLWLESKTRENLYLRREQRAKEQQIQFDTAAHLIQKIFLFYRKNKERCQQRFQRQQQQQRFQRETVAIVKIQRAYRGWRGRCLYCDQWRVYLLQEMRRWGHGNVQNLLERTSMQDPRSYQALLSAIAICSHHSRPLRLLPSVAIIKRSYQVCPLPHLSLSRPHPHLLPLSSVGEEEATRRL